MGLGIFKRFYKKKLTSKKRQISRPLPPRYPIGGRADVIEFEKQSTQGFNIPSDIPDDFPPAKSKGFGGQKKGKGQRQIVSLTYPLIPKKPKVGEFVYAYAKI